MRMNAGYILAGQPVDIVGNVDRGFQAGRRNRLAEIYNQHGPGIAAGEQESLNALAQFDPNASLGIQDARQAMDARGLNMDATRQRMRILDAQEARAVAEQAAAMSAAERQAAADQLARGIRAASGAQTPQQWDQIVQQFGAPELAGQFNNRDALLRQYMDVSDILAMDAPPKPLSAQGKHEADKRAGLLDPSAEFKPSGQVNIYNSPDPVAGDSVGDVYNPGEVNDTIRLIDEIMLDPNLERVTGPVEGGGGNDVANMNMARRMYYGADGLATIQKINQLQSRSWLAARSMLKGGGPITDYESRKAEAAVARLERAQGTEQYRAALQDLRDAITAGMEKLGRARQQGGQQPAASSQQQIAPEAPPSFLTPDDADLYEYMTPQERAALLAAPEYRGR